MTTEMFGMPVGFQAAEKDMRAVETHQLDVQKSMSDLAMQPDRARLLKAQADEAEGSAKAQEQLAEVGKLVAAKHAQGQIATVADLAEGKPATPGDYFAEMAQVAFEQGAHPVVTSKLAENAATWMQKQAAAGASAATQRLRELEILDKRLKTRGSWAASAIQAGPQGWAQSRQRAVDMAPPGQVTHLDALPQDYNRALPILRAAITESMEGENYIKLERQKALDAAELERKKAATAGLHAAKAYAEKKKHFLDIKINNELKNQGATSPAAQRAIEEQALTNQALKKAKLAEKFPALPVDPDDREEGQMYEAANGARYIWTQNPATGKMGLGVISPAPGTKAAKEIAATSYYRSGRPPKDIEAGFNLDDEED